MDVEVSQLDQDQGLGSWHPAIRPDSQSATFKYSQQAEESIVDFPKDEAQAAKLIPTEVPVPDLPSTATQHDSTLSVENDRGEDPYQRDRQLGLVNNEHITSAPNHVLATENDASSRETSTTETSSSVLRRSVGSAKEDGLRLHSECGQGNQSRDPHIPYPARDTNGDTESISPTQLGLGNKDRVKELDNIGELGEPPSLLKNYGIIDRTNSFPEVPPLRNAEQQPIHPLSHSQAQDIMEEGDEMLVDLRSGKKSLYDEGGEVFDPFDSITDGDETRFFVNASGVHSKVPKSPADEEARFEEGLPLMPSGSNVDQPTDDLSRFYDGQVLNSWVPQVSNGGYQTETKTASPDESSSFRPQPLDRKSTTQVLHSLQPSNGGDREEAGQDSLLKIHPDGDRSTTSQVTAVPESSGSGSRQTVEPNAELDFFGQDPKDEDLAAMWQAALGDDELLDEDEPSVDPAAFFDDDGEGFLDDAYESPLAQVQSQQKPFPGNTTQAFNNSDRENTVGAFSQLQYTPAPNKQLSAIPNSPYLPRTGMPQQLPQATFGMSHPSPAPASFTNTPHQAPSIADALSSTRPRMPQSTQSFADKSKGGYTSPYDLPMDVSRPKKRNYTQHTQAGSNAQIAAHNLAPPRSSSMYTGGSTSLNTPPPLPNVVGTSPSPSVANARPPTLKPKSSFFEELPSVKPRPSSGMAKAANVAQTNLPRQTSPQIEPARPNPARSASSSSGTTQAYQLLPPERMNPYANASPLEPVTQAMPVLNSRYSPAPVSQQVVPPPRNRYASSPSTAPRPQSAQILPFQPRTSSPLAAQNTSASHNASAQPYIRQASVSENSSLPILQQEPMNRQLGESPQSNRPSPPSVSNRYTPSGSLASSSYPLQAHESRHALTSNLPYSHSQKPPQSISDNANIRPPQRSQTQSPSAMRSRPDLPSNVKIPYQRPASVNQSSYGSEAPARSVPIHQEDQRRSPTSPVVNYIRPSDGRENDRLERWKGCPIFTFGFGGTIVSSFPKQIPRYAAGQSFPLIKCSPGEVKIHMGKAFPLEENIATFPGPLRSKSKKREVLDWLQKRIIELENAQFPLIQTTTLPDPRKRHEEKVILWRVIRALVENDGAIEGNSVAENSVRTILSPELAAGDDAKLPLYTSNAPLVGISRSAGSVNLSEPADSGAVEGLRKILLHGEREKAVWHAVDRRLWGHAMLLASTLDKTIWKQVLQEFNSQEVKAHGDNTESLAALYQIFAGNWEESVDQLVPPSARAGLQMVSKAATAGPLKNALDGLDRWRETLTLVLSNRTQDDGNALVALGRLLAGYGRTEAAHVCYIFAKRSGLFGGPDDPQVGVALLGADHLQQPYDYSRDFDSILLTEVYDFARTVLAPSVVVTVSPHLQSYKLYHALTLAEYGYRSEAQNYCDAVTSALKSTTKLSPYYHSLLFGALEDLVQRLRQAPKDGSTSMIAGLSMDKVSGSVWTRLNQFIAGDESDAESTTSAHVHDTAAGPFAKIAGGSPNISRPPSSDDLYGSYPTMGGIPPPLPTAVGSNSRYAPAGQYTPRSSLEQPVRPSQEFQRSAQSEILRPPFTQQRIPLARSRSASTKSIQGEQQHDLYKPPSQPSVYTAATESYLPTPPSQTQFMPIAPPDDISSSLHQKESYQPSPSLEPKAPQETYQPYQEPHSYVPLTPEESPSTSTYKPVQSTYEPPSTYDYDPPSYDPETETQGGNESPEQKSPKKKKSFMYGDDDDDLATKAAVVLRDQKAQKDREADEAFRKAAEVDGVLSHHPIVYPAKLMNSTAQKGPTLNAKKSWFGGWLGGKKESNDLNQPAGNAPIKAKLGEKSSFYYDKDLKKWVNPKGGDDSAAASPTPPPPRAPPPSRAVSGAGAPPLSTNVPPVPPLPALGTPPINVTRPPTSTPRTTDPPSRSDSATAAAEGTLDTETASPTSAVPNGLGLSAPPSAPPSRPSTAMSNASTTIDDLIGVPQARKGGTVKKSKKGRGYIDVMAK